MIDTIAARMIIPDGITFADLRLTRDPQTGAVEFDWSPLEAICAASGLDVALLRAGPEDNVSGLIVAWYMEHLTRGGARDPVQDELIEEALIEGARGEMLSHKPGRA